VDGDFDSFGPREMSFLLGEVGNDPFLKIHVLPG